MKDNEQILTIYGNLCDLQSRFSCALQNAHCLFAWFSECSHAVSDNNELDAFFSVIDHMDTLNELFDDYTSDLLNYLHGNLKEDEAEKMNQQREGIAPKD